MTRSPRVRLVTGADLPMGDGETRFLASELEARGWDVDVAVWSDPEVDWSDAPVTVIRSTWDYPAHLAAFLRWTESAAAVTALHNPPELIRRNVHKGYLLDLREAGVPVVPTRWVAAPDPATLHALAASEGWPEIVVKPVVGVDGLGVVRWRTGDPPPALPSHEAGWLLQPFLPSVAAEGERSVVLFEGVPSHAVSKHPGTGEFRVQERWGGRTRTAPHDPAADQAARTTLGAFLGPDTPPPLYARVDLLRHGGTWCVAEVEVVEPSFYLDGNPARVDPFEAALRTRLP